jgi:transposase-like protein
MPEREGPVIRMATITAMMRHNSESRLESCLPALGLVSQQIVHPRSLCEGGCRQTTTCPREGPRMDVHKNARTTPWSRALIAQRVQAGETVAAVGRAFGICDRTARKWVDRAARGELTDRSCRPQRSPRAIAPAVMVELQRLRQLGWTGAQIAEVVQVSRATVARTLGQLGLARLELLPERPPLIRYEWDRPGQLVHLDIKKLDRIGHVGHRITGDRRRQARGIGWEFVHVVSTTARGWPMQRFSATRKAPRSRPSCAAWCAGFAGAGCVSNASSPITVLATVRTSSAPPPRRSDSSTTHSTLHAADERQGRAVHSHHAAGVGIRPRVPQLGPSHRRPRALAALLQLAPPTSGTRRQAAHQQTRLA